LPPEPVLVPALPPMVLSASLLEQDSPTAPQHTTKPTARTWSIEAALIQRFMATPYVSGQTHNQAVHP
jgi:hypothetical protein